MNKPVRLVLATAMVLVACTAESGPPGSQVRASREQSVGSGARATYVYAAVIRRLVTRDHTFGSSRSPFKHLYIVDGAVDGDLMEGNGEPANPFSTDVKEGLRRELDGLPEVGFVSNPDSVRLGRNGMGGVKGDGVVITLGPVSGQAGKVEVPTSLWCGGLCGRWLTYVVELRGRRWVVTGTTGPAAIS